MSVTVVSDRCQEFAGVRYYLCGRYYQSHGKRLHRVVWSALNGTIPKRAHIHHIDGDKSNNQPANLMCIDAGEHLSYHGKLKAGQAAEAAAHARPSAMAWHASDAGREWHRKHYYADCSHLMHKLVELKCAHCGKDFASPARHSKFCSNACKSAARRSRCLDHVERKCVTCDRIFFAGKYTPITNCSRKCGWKSMIANRPGASRLPGRSP